MKAIVKSVLLVALLILATVKSFSQRVENKCDTLDIIAPSYLILNDTSIHILKDTTAIVCKKYVVISKKSGYNLYTKIVDETKKHRFVNQILQSLIASSNQDTMLMKQRNLDAEDVYKPQAGKIIRDIRIQVLKPFGSSINDTTLQAFTPWAQALNKSHISTQEFVIRKRLLFTENDTINPYELVENTKDLTRLNYLEDATIILTNPGKDSVDVLVLVKDKFPWLPQINIRSASNMTLGLYNVNMAGLGQTMGVGITYQSSSKPKVYLSDINYYINNLYKLISAEVNYHFSENDKYYQLKLYRNIIPLSVRLGGGFELTKKEENIVIDPTYKDQSIWYFDYNYLELWSTYLFYDKNGKIFNDYKHTFLVPGIAAYVTNYNYRPYVVIDSNFIYQNHTDILSNVALVQQNYLRTNYISYFGKAEYIPIGFRAEVIGGYTWSEIKNSPYAAIKFAGTLHNNKFGFISFDAQIGSHIDNKIEQGALRFKVSYLTKLFNNNNYNTRYMVVAEYAAGINRYTNDLLYLSDEFNIADIDNKIFYGKNRLFGEFVAITYTPWYFMGFRMALLGFVNGGILQQSSIPFFKNQLTSSIGLGIYTKNDFLAFNSLQVRVAYFPIMPEGYANFAITFTSYGLFEKVNYLHTKPDIVKYR